ncbi:MurR/RpiR family transcriptional regulator [Sinorhizobium meliloti WSM1022]|uniref:HTH rpiR-type domain-containing protein n=6 Tax=Sinorhizobium TaxID=28105 RepID=Q92NI6_RHIME|nr:MULTISPECIES: MurR/RpiR family transcriptional regulator [Sinorhizobium]PST24767.1 MurR/RpiR family transcriptional regulator [Mesorhizobium loti]TWA92521.1 RpiR family transcriptional regulator [Ensifer sp. SEMIA 134]TWB28586.1 RpiR family transcriptional regulator [Ensifer sp. SEMIA 135]AEG04945.1 transcriptional regulator, RpiR family [Sinorhizobium meliloti BL225C]AEG53916.1 transcriptional regulator, RpiR family [Sinorhizobium meliloti AK83]
MNGNTASMTVSDVINAHFAALTRAERQLAETLLDNYPVSGLGSITTVAENAGVSTPTVARMVQKLGFRGFPDFQARLHQELEATISNPIAKHDRWAASAPGTHTLNRFADAIMGNMRQTLSQIEPAEFDTAAALVADLKRKVYLVGGRITRSIADYLFTHLQVIRTGVTQIAANPSSWPHYVLDMKAGDVLILFDIRRYEQEMETLARFARNRGVEIILFTDQWGSPVAKSSSKVFRARIEVPSAWDSSVMLLFLVEALVEAVQSSNWDETRGRMKTLEGLFDSTRIFRKPV